jgi:hypothetical protein
MRISQAGERNDALRATNSAFIWRAPGEGISFPSHQEHEKC